MFQGKDEECEADLGEELNEQLPTHRNHVSEAEEGVGRKFFAELAGRLSQVYSNENWKGHHQVIVQHLIVSHVLVVVVEDCDCRKLSHGKEDHHTKPVKICAEPSSADPQAVDDCLETFRLGVEVRKEGTLLSLKLQSKIGAF